MSGSSISGTVTTAGTYPITVTVTDSALNTASQVFNLVVTAVSTNPVVGALGTQALTTSTFYSLTLTATQGTAPYTFSTTTLPQGLALSGAVISGTPTTSGTTSVTITVTDSLGHTGTEVVSFVVTFGGSTLTLAAVPTENLTVGNAFSHTLVASGGTAPYTYTTTALPAGLSLNAAIISGTPTTPGTTSVTATVTDSTTPTHFTANQTFSIVVAAVVTGGIPPIPTGTSNPIYPLQGTVSYASGLPAGANVYTGNVGTGYWLPSHVVSVTAGQANAGTPAPVGPGVQIQCYVDSAASGFGGTATGGFDILNVTNMALGVASDGYCEGGYDSCVQWSTNNWVTNQQGVDVVAGNVWPSDNLWPEGENDICEGNPTWGLSVNLHEIGTDPGDQYYGSWENWASGTTPWPESPPWWPVAVCNGLPHVIGCRWDHINGYRYYLDGTLWLTLPIGHDYDTDGSNLGGGAGPVACITTPHKIAYQAGDFIDSGLNQIPYSAMCTLTIYWTACYGIDVSLI